MGRDSGLAHLGLEEIWIDARPQSAVGPDHDTARRSLTAGQWVSGHLQRSLVASVSDRDASYGTAVSKMCHVRARCFFSRRPRPIGGRGAAGGPFPLPLGPLGTFGPVGDSSRRGLVQIPSYKVKEV